VVGIFKSAHIGWFVSGAEISLVIVLDEMLEARRGPHLIRVNSNQILQGATTPILIFRRIESQTDFHHSRQ
jgi:hypothetical protein